MAGVDASRLLTTADPAEGLLLLAVAQRAERIQEEREDRFLTKLAHMMGGG